jgi:hypothetical protein
MEESENVLSFSVDDFIGEGQAMEEAFKAYGRKDTAQAERRTFLKFREMAIGIIAVAIESFEDFTEEPGIDAKVMYLEACIVGFAQGAWLSLDLILRAQYMKATAVMKQDLELLARFHELADDRALKRTPNVAFAPVGSGQIYGKLNETAHPSCLEAIGSVLTTMDGNISVLPVRKKQIEYTLIYWHIWICSGFAEAATQMLDVLAGYVQDTPARSKILSDCDKSHEHLHELAEALSAATPEG